MERQALALLMALFAGACSDDGADTDETLGGSAGMAGSSSAGSNSTGGNSTGGASGGSSGKGGVGGTEAGTGGSSGGAGSSSGGSTSGAVRGSVSVNIVGGADCSLAAQYQDFPVVESGHPVDRTQKGGGVTDGGTTPDGQPVEVRCQWIGSTVSARIVLGPPGPTDRIINIGSPTEVGVPGQSGLNIDVPDLPAQYGSRSEPCTFTPLEVDETTRSVWGEFTCSSITTDDELDSCEVGPSYYFFENCTLP